jgi:hypothetical protein
MNQKAWEVLDFPSLKVSKAMLRSDASSTPVTISNEKGQISLDPVTDIVSIYDPVYKRTFRLIPLA